MYMISSLKFPPETESEVRFYVNLLENIKNSDFGLKIALKSGFSHFQLRNVFYGEKFYFYCFNPFLTHF